MTNPEKKKFIFEGDNKEYKDLADLYKKTGFIISKETENVIDTKKGIIIGFIFKDGSKCLV